MMTMMGLVLIENGDRGAVFVTNGNVKKNDRSLKDRHPDEFLNQVIFGDQGIEPNHHQDNVDPIVKTICYGL
jgi:hypothetical protein